MNSQKTIHLIGIGGIGMSGLARIYLSLGYAVQGSDLKMNEVLRGLEKAGARVLMGHDASHVNGAGTVVYSTSISRDHPERLEAARKGARLLHRAEALAEICEGKTTIAVTGTHGKTTTTALIGMILKEARRDPSIVVGGVVGAFGGNACLGGGSEIVIEADESDSSFLKFSPAIEVITNIEADHMEHFETIGRVEDAYRDFLRRLPADAEWIGCAEDARVLRLARENIRPARLYGLDPKNEFYATDIVECPQNARAVAFKMWEKGRCLGPVRLNLLGVHNVLNALGAAAVGLKLGVSFSVIAAALGKYEGAGRRFGVQYEDGRFLIVDDYAHHPTEIQKTLAAARALGPKRLFAVFQPHRFTRTQFFLKDFASSFSAADKLIVTDIYAASETPIPGVSGEGFCRAVRESGHADAAFVPRPEVYAALENEIRPGDLVMVLGAGDIEEVAWELAAHLNLFREVRGKVVPSEGLAKHTSLRIGGPAEFWIEPADAEDLRRAVLICRGKNLPIHIFGAGSNVLAPDEGLKGAVIHLGAAYFKEARVEKETITARAGVPNSLFIQLALENGFGGCEFLSGIPGNLGGAVAMNAGSHGQSMDSILEEITLLTFEGEFKKLKKSEIGFGYRSSGIRDGVIVEAVFRLPRRARETVQKKLDEYHAHRMNTQDLKHPSAGCLFKNPAEGARSSGKLIDEAGLKGLTVGRAQVSTVHANFLINLGGASAKDVTALIEAVRRRVREKAGVDLETEVKIL